MRLSLKRNVVGDLWLIDQSVTMLAGKMIYAEETPGVYRQHIRLRVIYLALGFGRAISMASTSWSGW